jgi:hypothetical protein
MKNLLLFTAIAVFVFSTANAQDEQYMSEGGFAKSDLYISGSVGLASVSKDGNSNTAYSISPAIGYFLSDNVALEADLTFSDAGTDDSSAFGAAIGAIYFFSPAKQFSFAVGGGFDYTSAEQGVPDSKLNSWFIGLTPGMNYFISDSFALRAGIGSLGYGSSKLDTDGAEATNTFGFSLDLYDIKFGLTYKF